MRLFLCLHSVSLPSRERGLKFQKDCEPRNAAESLPSRERGLKLDEFQSETGDYCVAPLAGAWIEIPEIKHHRNVIVSLPSRERGLKY